VAEARNAAKGVYVAQVLWQLRGGSGKGGGEFPAGGEVFRCWLGLDKGACGLADPLDCYVIT
jgi:hypothetical protein